jgi:hypothetical protein
MEIGYDPAYQDLPPWTLEQVLMQKSFDEPRAGTGQAYMEVEDPTPNEVEETYAFLDAHSILCKVTTKNRRVVMIATPLTLEEDAKRLCDQMQTTGCAAPRQAVMNDSPTPER